jgi:hypothetical protein
MGALVLLARGRFPSWAALLALAYHVQYKGVYRAYLGMIYGKTRVVHYLGIVRMPVIGYLDR